MDIPSVTALGASQTVTLVVMRYELLSHFEASPSAVQRLASRRVGAVSGITLIITTHVMEISHA